MVVVLLREISDHTPLLIDTDKPSSCNNVPMFMFEMCLLLRDGFTNMVRDVWNSVFDKNDMMRYW
jgi:hypothetical protein